jgi:hypothetical protein
VKPRTAHDTVNSILEGHRRGHYDLQQATSLLQGYTLQQPEDTKQQIFQILWSALSAEPLKEQPQGHHIIPSVHAVAIRSLATFGPTADLPVRVFGLLKWNDNDAMEFWARRICPQLSYSMFHNASRFAQSTLDQTKAFCSTYTFAGAADLVGSQFPQSVVDAAVQLEKTLEAIEYSRFATSLREQDLTPEVEGPQLDRLLSGVGLPGEVANAMSEAEKYLGGQGPFDPKLAADLVRSSMEQIHRALVAELEKRNGSRCAHPEKDGVRRAYMRAEGFISQPEEEFFSSIYTLVSREGTHKLIAEKETVLLMLEVVKGYLRLLLRRLHSWRTPPEGGAAL